jgi:hypothetical protein
MKMEEVVKILNHLISTFISKNNYKFIKVTTNIYSKIKKVWTVTILQPIPSIKTIQTTQIILSYKSKFKIYNKRRRKYQECI